MRRAYPDLQRAGIDVALVGMGTPAESAAFRRELELPFPVLSDPDRAAYRAFGTIVAGAREFLTPAAGRAMIGAALRGNRGGRPVGDVRQLGGTWLIDRAGVVVWARPSAFAGDHPAPADILTAAAGL